MKISLIVPCYNEEEALPIFYRETKNVLETMPCEHEFVFINDGSRDRTLAVLKELAGQDGCVQYIPFPEISERKRQCMQDFAMSPETTLQ